MRSSKGKRRATGRISSEEAKLILEKELDSTGAGKVQPQALREPKFDYSVVTVNFPDREVNMFPGELHYDEHRHAIVLGERLDCLFPGYTSAVITIVRKHVEDRGEGSSDVHAR